MDEREVQLMTQAIKALSTSIDDSTDANAAHADELINELNTLWQQRLPIDWKVYNAIEFRVSELELGRVNADEKLIAEITTAGNRYLSDPTHERYQSFESSWDKLEETIEGNTRLKNIMDFYSSVAPLDPNEYHFGIKSSISEDKYQEIMKLVSTYYPHALDDPDFMFLYDTIRHDPTFRGKVIKLILSQLLWLSSPILTTIFVRSDSISNGTLLTVISLVFTVQILIYSLPIVFIRFVPSIIKFSSKLTPTYHELRSLLLLGMTTALFGYSLMFASLSSNQILLLIFLGIPISIFLYWILSEENSGSDFMQNRQ